MIQHVGIKKYAMKSLRNGFHINNSKLNNKNFKSESRSFSTTELILRRISIITVLLLLLCFYFFTLKSLTMSDLSNQSHFLGLEPMNLNVACNQTANWRDYIDAHSLEAGTGPIYGFFIPIDSLQAVMQEAVKGVRVYMALNAPDQLSSLHLLLVPTNGDNSTVSGNDILYNPVTNQSTVYDTTMPCPTVCGDPNVINSNTLMGGKQAE